MKKFFKTILALVLAVLVSTGGLFGCNLVITDNDKDMARVIATVKFENTNHNIYKKDLAVSYMNYGYIYEQYYGWTKEKTVNFIVNSLIETRVLVQSAIIEFNDKNLYINETPEVEGGANITDKWNPLRYLDKDERVDAVYNAYVSMNSLLENYAEEQEGKADTSTITERAVPTNASNEDLSTAEKEAYIAKGFKVNGDYNAAFKQVRKVLDTNGLLGKDYNGSLDTTDFYKNSLKSNQENKILEKFEKYVQSEARSAITFSQLNEAYKEDLDTAKGYNEAEFASAMSSATAESPLLYGAYGNYGYVYNLLLGVNEYQSAEISALKTTLSSTERMAERKKILAETTAIDLRDSWVYSGNDANFVADKDGETDLDVGTLTFTGDYTFNSDYSLPFQGKVKLLQTKENGEKVYGVENKKTFNLPEFVSFVERYVYGSDMSNAGWSGKSEYTDAVYKVVNSDAEVAGYTDKINELLFAFSTDGGSLNTYKGYAVAPEANGTSSETYMAEFAEASRQLFSMGKSSYIIVATDYGYHFVFFSKVFSLGNTAYETLEEYLDAEYGDKDWSGNNGEYANMLANWEDYEDTDNYLYLLANRISQNAINRAIEAKRTEIINEHIYGPNSKVTKYEKVYEDLLK